MPNEQPTLLPGPRPVPRDWWLRSRLGLATLCIPVFGCMLGLFGGLFLYQSVGAAVLGVTSLGAFLVTQLLVFALSARETLLWRRGLAVKPRVIEARPTGHHWSRVGSHFEVFSGWDKVKEVSRHEIVDKVLRLELPDGRSHTLTVQTYPESPPIYLVDPQNPRRHLPICKLSTVPRPDQTGQWPAVPPRPTTRLVAAANGVVFLAALGGLIWSIVAWIG
ncbi:MAG: hypothetical protein JXB32_05755 [Deltaproteobacteria bacterium]|nr:hypothetical protein [Deltaproteobacteria bacterium]